MEGYWTRFEEDYLSPFSKPVFVRGCGWKIKSILFFDQTPSDLFSQNHIWLKHAKEKDQTLQRGLIPMLSHWIEKKFIAGENRQEIQGSGI